ncbi:helix-turn-helix domain-containing protein [Actinomyces haliotis]|uniref:helix-turn-helix domain-containing protein n=1 Tax=Actinomyces haliotis TaxID=1280843 RepID=UPI00188E8EDB|nr:helix-turn-helix transcriptional regulator [Actinomyces haliotis]
MNSTEFHAARLALGLNQAALAELLDVKQQTVSRWEHGLAPVPDGVSAEIFTLGARLDELTAACVEQGRASGVITIVEETRNPMGVLLMVAAGTAQRALAAESVPTTITAQ